MIPVAATVAEPVGPGEGVPIEDNWNLYTVNKEENSLPEPPATSDN